MTSIRGKITKEVEEQVALECNNCRHVESDKSKTDANWFWFSSNSSDYETDDTYDVCSPGCYLELLSKIIEDFPYNDGQIGEMPFNFAKRLVEWLG